MIKQLYNKEIFFFIYNKVKNKNLILGFNIKKFYSKHNIAIEFTIYAITIRIIAKIDQIFNYNLRLYRVYFIANERKPISNFSRIKYESNE